MTTEQINLRLDAETVAALERLADSESLDRSTVVRRLLEDGIERLRRSHALASYQRGEISIGRAAEEAGVTIWEALALARDAGIAHPARIEDVDPDLEALSGATDLGRDDECRTLADIPPAPGGILLVGINPAPKSVAAGHYYQGALGRRLWQRLARLGLLVDPQPGAEDIAFARMGHGLTDVVKRPTAGAGELHADELRRGAAILREKIADWRPGLVVFVFKQAAASTHASMKVKPGLGPSIGDIPTFLLSGPYAPSAQAAEVDRELAELAMSGAEPVGGGEEAPHTALITEKNIARGIIRLPTSGSSASKGLFPPAAGRVHLVIRGHRFDARYNPHLRDPDGRERSGVISIPKADLAVLVRPNERLRVSRGRGGVLTLD